MSSLALSPWTRVCVTSLKVWCSYEIGETAKVPGANVTFVDANHCPGAAMLLFEVRFRGQTHRNPSALLPHARRAKSYAPHLSAIAHAYFRAHALSYTLPHPRIFARTVGGRKEGASALRGHAIRHTHGGSDWGALIDT
jgi:hypothetical protein